MNLLQIPITKFTAQQFSNLLEFKNHATDRTYKLDDYQINLLDKFENGDSHVVVKCRQSGISTTLAVYAAFAIARGLGYQLLLEMMITILE